MKIGEIKSPRYDRFLVPLEIRLLGHPQIKIDGKQQPSPKGRKVWGLLAYLILTDRHPARSWLAGVLFGDAEDPLGALRWSLAELRRLLGDGVTLGGDPVVLTLPPETFVDVTASAPFEPGRELIEGADFGSSPGFDAWLMAERRRLAAQSIATARQNVMTMLAVGELVAAIRLATRLVEVDLLDEGAHALLIRCLMASGDRAGANGQFESARQILWRELGVEPGPELVAAHTAASPAHEHSGSRPGRLAFGRAQLEAGQAAIAAGALDAGINSLREAAAAGSDASDEPLRGRALAELGSALIHSVRGRDGEGAAVLHVALRIAEEAGDDSLTARAASELGWVELLAGRYATSLGWFERASDLLADDPGTKSWAIACRGVALCDGGRHEAGLAALETAARLAEEAGHKKNLSWSLAFIGRSRLLRGELDLARPALEAAHRLARESWPYFIPFPESLLGDVALAASSPDRALELYEDAFAHACHLADPCWEGLSLRGVGLHSASRGHTDQAIDQLLEACSRAVRFDDTYKWAVAYCRDGLVEGGVRAHSGQAASWAADLESMAGRLGMHEFAARAHLYMAALGDDTALQAARALAGEVENPALDARIASHASSHA
jgi:DNA-binding SARP family transcriptional activator